MFECTIFILEIMNMYINSKNLIYDKIIQLTGIKIWNALN